MEGAAQADTSPSRAHPLIMGRTSLHASSIRAAGVTMCLLPIQFDQNQKPSSRKKVIIPLAVGIALLFGVLLSLTSFDLPLNPEYQPATAVFCFAFGADLSPVRGADVRPGPKPSEALCGKKAGCPWIEIPHASGSGESFAFVPSRHRHVLLRLCADEPVD